jgi:adenosylmethionine-8-amino-7-oxononanoate aminotransferase
MKSHVFHRDLSRKLPLAKSGEGVYITDDNGRRYLDASGGAVVVNLGHGRKEMAEIVGKQLKQGYYFHATMFTNDAVEELAGKLADHAPGAINRFYFMSSGSEAVETAIKLARQIQLARGEQGREQLISRWTSYHGLTLGALAASGRRSFRVPFQPLFTDALHIEPPYCMRCVYGLKPSSCGLRCAEALENLIVKQGPQTISAFIAETVSGSSLAVYPPPAGYWQSIRQICDRHGVLLIQDEVMCGMGRTGKWFASEHEGVVPDMVTLGKGLTGGALPLSAVGVKEEHYQLLVENGGFAHGGTFSHHPVCASAGLAAVTILEREKLIERSARMGAVLGKKLIDALADSPYVADVRGLGMMWGIELVKDHKSLAPFPRAERVAERLWSYLFDHGVIVYKSLAMAGEDGDGLVVSPPFIIDEPEMDVIAMSIREAVNRVIGNGNFIQ